MKLVTLGELCEMSSGGTPLRSEARYYTNGTIPWVKIGDIENAEDGVINRTEESITEEGLAAINDRAFAPGTVLFAMYGSVGKVAVAGIPLSTNQAILGIRPDLSRLDAGYLVHWLKSRQHEWEHQARGVALKNLSAGIVKQQKIPLPPLPTQRRIAAVLDKAQALVANDRQTLALYDQLAKSLFLELFGDPVRNERGWEVVKLGDVVTDVVGGESVGGDERPLEKGEWAVLKISAVTRGVFDATEYKVADLAQLKRAPVIPKRGDLLFSRANTREMVGATCVVNQDCTNLFLPDKLWRLDMDPAATNAWYLHHLLHHGAFRASTLGSLATGTSGSMLNISKAKLLGMSIPLPPYKVQQRFADGIEAMNTQRAQAEQSLRQSEGLFGSLLQGAFTKG